jgi:hypothetical protein
MSAAKGSGPDLVVTVEGLIDDLNKDNGALPYDDLKPGFRLTPETRIELCRIVLLLQESRRLLKQAIDRETPRFEASE